MTEENKVNQDSTSSIFDLHNKVFDTLKLDDLKLISNYSNRNLSMDGSDSQSHSKVNRNLSENNGGRSSQENVSTEINIFENYGFNILPLLMANEELNKVPHPNNSFLPYLVYPSFSESVNENLYFGQMHLPSYNCIRYNLCRSRTNSDATIEPPMQEQTSSESISVKGLRNWQTTRSGHSLKLSKKSGFTFKLMCYNVLAQSLLEEHPELYRYHPQRFLKWEERWKNLRQEIIEQDPDILCLQEVEETHLEEYYNTLETLGYKSLYKRRTGTKVDGCALFYKNYLMNLVEQTTVEYNQSYNVAFDRDNVAIIAKFSPRLYPNLEFIIATTHLLYNPKREDIRLAQTQFLLTELDRMAYKAGADESHPYVPVILTGDFNLEPYSPVYRLITYGVLHYENLTIRSLEKASPGQNVTGKCVLPPQLGVTDKCQHIGIIEKRRTCQPSRDEEMELIRLQNSERSSVPERKWPAEEHRKHFCTGTLSHNLALQSAFKHKIGDKHEATTYQNRWITVDYIFYSGIHKSGNIVEDKLKLVARYTIPTADQLQGVRIPNSELGSDHLSIVAKFKLEE